MKYNISNQETNVFTIATKTFHLIQNHFKGVNLLIDTATDDKISNHIIVIAKIVIPTKKQYQKASKKDFIDLLKIIGFEQSFSDIKNEFRIDNIGFEYTARVRKVSNKIYIDILNS